MSQSHHTPHAPIPSSSLLRQTPISPHDVAFVMRIFARAEAQTLVRRRMAVRDLKDRSNRHRNVTQAFDIEHDVERSLELVECLPQGSRGIQPPHAAFLSLAKAVTGEIAHPARILEHAILLEEFALELLAAYTTQRCRGSTGETPSPWAVPSGMRRQEGRRPTARSEAMLSWPDRWTAHQTHRLLAAISTGELRGTARPSDHYVSPYRLQARMYRYGPRKRRRRNAPSSDVYTTTTTMQENDDEICQSDSSDCYPTSSDEELGFSYKLEKEETEIPTSVNETANDETLMEDETYMHLHQNCGDGVSDEKVCNVQRGELVQRQLAER